MVHIGRAKRFPEDIVLVFFVLSKSEDSFSILHPREMGTSTVPAMLSSKGFRLRACSDCRRHGGCSPGCLPWMLSVSVSVGACRFLPFATQRHLQGYPYVGFVALTFLSEPDVAFSITPENILGGAVSAARTEVWLVAI